LLEKSGSLVQVTYHTVKIIIKKPGSSNLVKRSFSRNEKEKKKKPTLVRKREEGKKSNKL